MECQSLIYIHKNEILVPCGRCAFCTATLRSDWAVRLHYEAKKHVGSKFVTLTYNNENLKWAHNNQQLDKEDLQNFFKRLRKAGHKARYFAVGEYGSQTFRPHYHIILFGEVSDDAINKAWSIYDRKTKKHNPIGYTHIGTVTTASIMYCLGYVVNGKGWKMKNRRQPPFTVMSRKPGIGSNYLTKEMIEWHKSGRKNYTILDGEKKHLPRYYKTKIFSKIDLVRVAVRDQKQVFLNSVKWLRSPAMRRKKDPIGYRNQQLKLAAQRIKRSLKINLTI